MGSDVEGRRWRGQSKGFDAVLILKRVKGCWWADINLGQGVVDWVGFWFVLIKGPFGCFI